MQIHFERSGGFAGIGLTHNVSTDSLPEEERSKLEQLIKDIHFFELPAVMRASGSGADRFQYRIYVESNQGKHEVLIDEAAMPPQLRPLITWLLAAARKR